MSGPDPYMEGREMRNKISCILIILFIHVFLGGVSYGAEGEDMLDERKRGHKRGQALNVEFILAILLELFQPVTIVSILEVRHSEKTPILEKLMSFNFKFQGLTPKLRSDP